MDKINLNDFCDDIYMDEERTPLEKIIDSVKSPLTKSKLVKEFKRIGIEKGDVLLVHSSLSKLGWVCGGEISVINALIEAVGEEGTIVMPAHSSDMCDPVFWSNPPVPEAWFDEIREEMPPFDPKITPTYNMGKIAESFRNFPKVERSNHPTVSFSAVGKYADFITENHSLEFSLGENSPLARLYDLNGKVLFLGVDYDVNTSFHLSEYRALNYSETINISPIIENGNKVFKKYKDIEFKTELFMFAGEEFEETEKVKKDKVGNGEVKIFNIRDSVDFGVTYFKKYTSY